MAGTNEFKVSANYEILMDYYINNANIVVPQPIINDVDVVFKGKYSTLALGKVSLKFVDVSEGCIELRVLTQLREIFSILIFKQDDTTTLEITY